MNILDALITDELFGEEFTGDSWETWRSILGAAFVVPLTDEQKEIFSDIAGGRALPTERVRELWVVAGRRSAKTQNAAAVAVYLATIGAEIEGLKSKLSRGEKGVVCIVACDRQQAKVALRYVAGLLEHSPIFSQMVERVTTDSVELNNDITIEVVTNSFRAVRGKTLICAILDEVAFFRSESTVNPDQELYRAILPALATTGGLMLAISSPYARQGLLYEKYRRHFGQNSDVLVVQGSTARFNPTLDPRVIAQAIEEDPEAAQAEWLGQFRNDISSFIDRQSVESCVRQYPLNAPPMPSNVVAQYVAACDPSGGGKDEFTLAIGHRDPLNTEKFVVDTVQGRTGSPAEVVAQYVEVLKSYRVKKVQGDRYAGQWVSDEFAKHGIQFEYIGLNRSELYQEFLPVVLTGRIELPNDSKLVNQICSLERRTSRSGKDSIDHAIGAHDDRANVTAALAYAIKTANANTLPKVIFQLW